RPRPAAHRRPECKIGGVFAPTVILRSAEESCAHHHSHPTAFNPKPRMHSRSLQLTAILFLLAPLAARAQSPALGDASDPAIRTEIERRTALDFAVTPDKLLAEIRESIPDVTADDIARWTESGDLVSRTIDGQPRYFRNAAANLFRTSEDARKR